MNPRCLAKPPLDAVLYEIVACGEAARRLSQELRERHSDVPWRDIIGMRSVVTHGCRELHTFREATDGVETVPTGDGVVVTPGKDAFHSAPNSKTKRIQCRDIMGMVKQPFRAFPIAADPSRNSLPYPFKARYIPDHAEHELVMGLRP